MATPAFPGLFLCFAALVLLIFATVSAPIWDKISFLDVHTGGRTIHFGVFGYTGISARLGYQIDPSILEISGGSTSQLVIRPLTFALVLHPIAAGFTLIAVIFGLCGLTSRVGTILMAVASALATIATLVVFVIDMVLFGIARNRIRDQAGSKSAAQYGNANWMVLGAFVALLLGFCSSFCGVFGRYSRRRGEKV